MLQTHTCRSFSWLDSAGDGAWLQDSWNWQAFCQNYLKVGILLPTCPSKLDFSTAEVFRSSFEVFLGATLSWALVWLEH